MRSLFQSLLPRGRAVARLLGAVVSSVPATAQVVPSGQVQWVAPIYSLPAGPMRNLANRGATFDAYGNAYVGFEMEGEVAVGDSILRNGYHNGVVRYTPTGQATWVRNFGPNAHITGLAADQNGNVVAAGWFDGPITLDGQVLQPQGSDIFLVKWDAAGQMVWARQGLAGTNPATRRVSHLAVDAQGEIYIAGTADGQAAFGASALVGSPVLMSSEADASYCARYNAAGDLVWVTGSDNHSVSPYGTRRWTNVSGLGTDSLGHVYLTGSLPWQFRWGAGAPILGDTTNLQTFYWLRLDAATGQYQTGFAEKMDGAGGARMAVDQTGHSYLVQQLLTTSQLNGTPLLVPPPPAGSNFSSAIYVARLNPDGLPQWVEMLTKNAPNDMLNVMGISVNEQHRLAIAVTYRGDTLVVGAVGLGRHRTAVPAALVFDTQGGAPQWTKLLATGTTSFHQAQKISLDGNSNVLVAGAYVSDTARFGSLAAATPGAALNRGKLFVAFVQPSGTVPPPAVPNVIAGTVYIDANANGRRDTMEAPAPAGIVLALSDLGPYAVTDSAGNYRLEFGIGTFNLVFAELPANYQAAPVLLGPIGANALGVISIVNQHVPIVPVALRPDGRLTLTAYTDAEPGLPLRYRLTIENTGTAPLAGSTVALDFDSRLTYVGTSLPGATVSGRRLSAAAPALLPGERRAFDVTFQVPTTTPVAATLACEATLAVPLDGALADNTSTAARPVVAARVAHTAEVDHTSLSLPQVAANEWLTYTVRFRNDGTAPVPTVALAATLAGAHIRRGSVQVLASSHPVTFAIGPNTVDFTLNGANLPPYSQNTIGALGFVTFRVRVQAGLAAGTLIRLDAALTLGAQAPVALSALTRIGGTTGLAATAAAAAETTLWPNPAREMVSLETALPGPLAVALLDGVGRVVRTATLSEAARRLSVAGLPAGLYTLRATAPAPAGGTPITVVRRLSVVAAE